MKFVILLLVAVAFVVVQSSTIRPTTGGGTDGAVCAHQSDCGAGLCCVHNMFEGKKKRFVFESGSPFDNLFKHGGICHTFRMMNESCMPFMSHDIFNSELYENHCPCEKGLECRGETVDEGPHSIKHTNPKCQAPEK